MNNNFGLNTFNLSEMKLFYTAVFLMTLAEGMIAIFVPVYLFKLNYSISSIIFFYFLISLCFLMFSISGARITSKIGVKHSILLSTFLIIIFYLSLNAIANHAWLFFITPLLMALHMIFYNYGYHLNFFINSNMVKRGEQVSRLGIIHTLGAAVGPLIAGVIITVFSFSWLFLMASVLLIFGAGCLLITHEKYEPIKIDFKKSFKYFLGKGNGKNLLSFSGYAIESIINRIIWPIYLIMIILTYDTMGLIVTLSLIISILVFYFIGKMTDRYDRRKLIWLGTFLYLIAWLGRLMANSVIKIFAVDTYKNIAEKILLVPWETIAYDLASKEEYFVFIVTREMAFNLPRIIILPLIALIFYIDFHPFMISFILAALFSLLYPMLKRARG